MSPSNLFSAHLRHQGDQRLLHRASFDFQPGVEVAVAARRWSHSRRAEFSLARHTKASLGSPGAPPRLVSQNRQVLPPPEDCCGLGSCWRGGLWSGRPLYAHADRIRCGFGAAAAAAPANVHVVQRRAAGKRTAARTHARTHTRTHSGSTLGLFSL